MNKVWVVILNNDTKRRFVRYFESEKEKEKYLKKMKYFLLINKFILIEDSSDIVYEERKKKYE